MGLEDEVNRELSGKSQQIDPMRTIDSIKNELIYSIASKRNISGAREMSQGLTQIIEMKLKDQDFDNALSLIASKILNLFPNVTFSKTSNELN